MILLGEEVVTGFLHHPGDAQAVHLRHGEHLDAQVLQDVTGGQTDNGKKLKDSGCTMSDDIHYSRFIWLMFLSKVTYN